MPGTITVFWGKVPPADAVAGLVARLSEAEQAQAAALRHADDRTSFVYAHALLAYALDEMTGGRAPYHFVRTPAGQPLLAGGGADFSLTRRRRMVAVAVSSDGPVGIDIEALPLDFDPMPIAEHLFAVRELAALVNQSDEAVRADLFVTFWTLKEAMLKACGLGLATGLAAFTFEASVPPRLLSAAPDGSAASEWAFVATDLPEHRLAVAHRAEGIVSLCPVEDGILEAWAGQGRAA